MISVIRVEMLGGLSVWADGVPVLDSAGKVNKPWQVFCFLVLNLYSMGLSALLARTLAGTLFGQIAAPDTHTEQGELYVQDPGGKRLPLGVFLRFRR